MDDVAIAFPELRIVMAHMGHPWHADTIAVIRKHPHVYADVSANFYRPWQLYHGLRLAIEWNVLDKLVFWQRLSGGDAAGDFRWDSGGESYPRRHRPAARPRGRITGRPRARHAG